MENLLLSSSRVDRFSKILLFAFLFKLLRKCCRPEAPSEKYHVCRVSVRSGVREQSADVGQQTARLRSRLRAAGRGLRQERSTCSTRYLILIRLPSFHTPAFYVSCFLTGTSACHPQRFDYNAFMHSYSSIFAKVSLVVWISYFSSVKVFL